MSEEETEHWRVTWGLEILHMSGAALTDESFLAMLNAPDVNVFLMPFSSREEAAAFVGEIQRYTGGLVARLLGEGVKLKVETR